MKHSFLLLACFFIAGSSSAQQNGNRELDSLLKAFDSAPNDTVKLRVSNDLASYYEGSNINKSLEYYEKSLELAKRIQRPVRIANAYYGIGYCYLFKGDYEKSLDNYLKSVKIYEDIKDSGRLSNAFLSVGNVYAENKDFKKMVDYYNQAKVLVEALNDSDRLGNLYSSIGTNYDRRGMFDSAIVYEVKSYQLGLALKDDGMTAYALSNLGVSYKHKGNLARALQIFDSTLLMFKAMDAPFDNMASTYNNIAATQSQAGNYAAARKAFDTSLSYATRGSNIGVVMENYKNMAEMYGNMKNYELEAGYLKKYYNIKDSLFTTDNANQLTQLEADYQLEKKNTEIVKKEAEVSQQRAQRNLFIFIAIAAAFILAGLAFFYTRIRKNNRLLQEKNIQINKQRDELQTLNQVKDRLFSIISHDLRNPLVTLRSYLSLAESTTISEEKKTLFRQQTMSAVSHTTDMLDNLLAWANMQIRNSKPSIVPVDLEECITDVLHHVQPQAMQKQVTIRQQIGVTAAAGDQNILAIAIRNLLTNAVKYSEPGKEIDVTTQKENETVLITVKDQGVGLSPEQLKLINASQGDSTAGTGGEKGSGLGLFLVKELLQKINAELLVESKKGAGSSFTIKLPAM